MFRGSKKTNIANNSLHADGSLSVQTATASYLSNGVILSTSFSFPSHFGQILVHP